MTTREQSKTRAHLTLASRNVKTGPMPVSTSDRSSCWSGCAFFNNGCYAESGHVRMFWNKVTSGAAGAYWSEVMAQIKKLPKGTLWRHNQAGDLPGLDATIDAIAMRELIAANKGKRGFTFTHKPVADHAAARANRALIKESNDNGFTVNLSGNNLEHADSLADMGIGPVVTVLPADQLTPTRTPGGRVVAICPAVLSDSITCQSCGLCALRDRKAIIGFPAHGTSKAKASAVAAAH